ncbi:ABC transporter ATP-binding protein [Georgenia halophila]|uniref:ABC transporter ATP-binding protein n=1 Tax=Georgenia halophila TaxID=620889 RepID=UPI0031EA3AF8
MRDLRKEFRRADGSAVRAIDGVSLDVAPGEFVVLLGPSGCGKTTLLRSIAGLEQPDSGAIHIRGVPVYSSDDVIDLAPERRKISMIFQSYALWPHMTVFQNVVYPLKNAPRPRLSKTEMTERVSYVLDLLGIGQLAGQHPGQMSGGQQQRVALARALAPQQDLILFDEPLSNVDAKVREQLRLELLSMQAEIGFSAIYVTHDQTEAMELADRVAVLRDGRVEQIGSPHEIYSRPTSRYVADFIGTSNEVTGTVEEVLDSGAVRIQTAIGPVLGGDVPGTVAVGDQVVLLARPERFRLEPQAAEPNGPNSWTVEGDTTLFLGAHSQHIVRLEDLTLRVWSADQTSVQRGQSYRLSIDPAAVRVLPEKPKDQVRT